MRIQAAVSRRGDACPRLGEVDLAAPRLGEMRIRIAATGICHTDLSCHSGRGMPVPDPVVLGHEGAGVVDAVGEGVVGFEKGDAVVLSGNSCGCCPACHAARPMYCRDGFKLTFGAMRVDESSPMQQNGRPVAGSFFGQSSFATHVIVSVRSAIKVARDLPVHLLGPLGCGMITGAGSVLEALRVRPGDSMVIFGTGNVGLAAVMAARIVGAFRIVAVDVDATRLSLATSLGATDTVLADAGTGAVLREIAPHGFDFSFNTVTSLDTHRLAVECLAPEGTAGFVARPIGDFVPPMTKMLSGGITLRGILGGNAVPQRFIPKLIDWWRRGLFPFERLITEFDFSRIDEAWRAFGQGEVIKPILRMPE